MKIKYTIKETKYIRKDVVVAYYIQNHVEDLDTTTKILQSLEFANKVTAEDIFEDYDNFAYGNNRYVVLKGEMGIFIVREDNVKCYYKNTKEKLGIDYLFSSGNKTFLIDGYGFKFITTRQKEDTDDIEKAIMMLLLKRYGYTYKDITDLVAEMDYNEINKKSTKSNKKGK